MIADAWMFVVEMTIRGVQDKVGDERFFVSGNERESQQSSQKYAFRPKSDFPLFLNR